MVLCWNFERFAKIAYEIWIQTRIVETAVKDLKGRKGRQGSMK